MTLKYHLSLSREEERPAEASNLDTDGNASPAAIFEAAYSLQQCTSWREARDMLLDLCRRRPEVAGCQPVVTELMAKLQGTRPGVGGSAEGGPQMLGEKFGNFVAVFRRHLMENGKVLGDPHKSLQVHKRSS